MDNVEFDREPPANLTTMVMAFGGWIDAGRAATGEVTALKGMFGPAKKTISIEAMNAAIARRGAAAR